MSNDSASSEVLSRKELIAALLALSHGDLSARLPSHFSGRDAELAAAFNEMARNLHDTAVENAERHWVKTNEARFSRLFQGQRNFQSLARQFFSELNKVITVRHGALYRMDAERLGSPLRAFHFCRGEESSEQPAASLGVIVGQCVAEKRTIIALSAPPPGCDCSADPAQAPLNFIALPVLFEGKMEAVLELGAREPFSRAQQSFLEQVREHLGIVLHTIKADETMHDLLRQSQSLARELQRQQQLLQRTNEELEDKARLLVLQKTETEAKNREIEQARQALQDKAAQMALTSKYKSEFLANMSHELRTPLNSMLLLARQLADNQEQTLTSRQLDYAKVIHAAGQELLRLINDILDLSKIESGTVTVDVGALQFWELREFVERNFRPLAKSRSLEFSIELDSALPAGMQTDARRLEQILKNLLANAFKFTEKGGVQLQIRLARSGWSADHSSLHRTEAVVAFSVIDTGIGISQDKQKIIFEAFQQEDGGTSRKFGGTGLGLTISREIARLLGGEIHLRSAVGEGSAFTLYLPLRYPNVRAVPKNRPEKSVELVPRDDIPAQDDRESIQPGDRVLLCVEDDPDFSACLLNLARKHGFKGVIAARGRSALDMLPRYQPSAITLDLTLPDMDGWKILERLKETPDTRHIPVAVISVDQERSRGLHQGAAAFLVKPVPPDGLSGAFARLKEMVEPGQKKLLICGNQSKGSLALASDFLGIDQVLVSTMPAAQTALAALRAHRFDCLALDLDLPDMSGLRLIEQGKRLGLRHLPVILFCQRELTSKEKNQLRRLDSAFLIRQVRSQERLLDEAALFLHLPAASLSREKRRLLEKLHCGDELLTDRRVFIIDDDIRNIYALTSLLERHGMRVASAESGPAAVKRLEEGLAADVALVDIMMPGFDGYEVMRALRKQERFQSLPLIAVTAKAMREDRLKCLEAGASDYVAKPVDTQQLLAALRRWLYR